MRGDAPRHIRSTELSWKCQGLSRRSYQKLPPPYITSGSKTAERIFFKEQIHYP